MSIKAFGVCLLSILVANVFSADSADKKADETAVMESFKDRMQGLSKELIGNGDFHKGLAGWSYNPAISEGAYKLYAEKGKMIIECSEIAKVNVAQCVSGSSVEPGASYKLQYRLRAVRMERKPVADSGGNIYVFLWDYPVEGGERRTFYFNECMMLEGDTAVDGEFLFTVPADYKGVISVYARIYNAKGRLEVEKVSLTRI